MSKSDLRNIMAALIVGLNEDVRIDLRQPEKESHRQRFDNEVKSFVQGSYALVDYMMGYEKDQEQHHS